MSYRILQRREILTLIPVSSVTGQDAWKPEALTADQARLVDQLSEIILPRTDTPGASDAKVYRYIDKMLKDGMTEAERTEFLRGLEWFAGGNSGFTAALTAMSKGERGAEGLRFFRRMKDLTLRGYYTSREGLLQELEYKGNGVYTAFPGCTHPEHK